MYYKCKCKKCYKNVKYISKYTGMKQRMGQKKNQNIKWLSLKADAVSKYFICMFPLKVFFKKHFL